MGHILLSWPGVWILPTVLSPRAVGTAEDGCQQDACQENLLLEPQGFSN